MIVTGTPCLDAGDRQNLHNTQGLPTDPDRNTCHAARAEVRSHLLQEEHYTMRRDEEHNILTRSDAT